MRVACLHCKVHKEGSFNPDHGPLVCAQVAAVLAAQGKKVGLVDMDLCGKLLGRAPGLGLKAESFGFILVQAPRQGRGTRSRAALPCAHKARQQTHQRGESETRVDARTERERERERREREPESHQLAGVPATTPRVHA